ncbi:BatD family protein [Grimontia sp. NTOU-MAR1]|uniref:BatD family protein n=1 Tax=Grimontia sp. NTOU-MAR1 TaxID=3111011 RepID=UPI002DBC4D34|nr:BatD family protein [Grimontia sp. NTOU-MAR1]WRV99099.1 BatD family protein [Grimontia sp. NTOU-MAR1]
MIKTTGSFTLRFTRIPFKLLSLLFVIVAPAAVAASAVATVSQNVVPVGEAFQLTISVDDSVDSDTLDLTPLSADFIFGRPSVSNSTSVINGSMSRKTEWRVAVAAKQTGTYTLPSLDIDGMKTEPITIQVVNASQKNSLKDKNAVKLTATVDRVKGYIGETFNYRIRLMIGIQLDSPTLQAPKGEGLDVKQVGEDVQAEAVLNGRRYLVISRLYQITPTKAGSIKLQGAVFSGTEVKSNGWGSSLGLPIEREAESMTLEVLDKPTDYQGLWLPTPSLKLSQSWQPDSLDGQLSVEVGEAINREITLKIKNIKQSAMPNLSLNYPQNVRVYTDKTEYSRDGEYTVMTVKQVIIPRDVGDTELPELSINWFNTQTEQPQTSELKGLSIAVKSGKNAHSSLNTDNGFWQ